MVIISLKFGRLRHKVHEAVESDEAECAGVLLEGVRESRHAACTRKAMSQNSDDKLFNLKGSRGRQIGKQFQPAFTPMYSLAVVFQK